MASNDGDWFAPKRVGYGSGLPIAWQGWVTLIVYLAVTLTAAIGVRYRPIASVSAIVLATIAFTWICATHTRGGWKWRSGGED